MKLDISHLAWTVRRQDVSATLRAFAAPAGIAAAWIWLGLMADKYFTQPEFREALPKDTTFIAGAVVLVLVTALAPLWFIVIDAMSRRPWRAVSGVIGFLAGALLHIALIVGLLWLTGTLLSTKMSEIERSVDEFVSKPFSGWLAFSLAAASIGFAVGSALWLLIRTVGVERSLAGPTPRAVLVGEIRGRSQWSRVAYLFGLPSSSWRATALILPSVWLLFAARPILYSGAAFAVWIPFASKSAGVDAAGLLALVAAEAAHALSVPVLWFLAAAGLGLVIVAHALFAFAKRLSSRRIWSGDKGTRAPILFLRSFKDDRLEFKREGHDLLGRWLDLWSFRRNADEMLIDEFAQYGPVIALGRPGEKAPPFGAQRRYATDAEWQDVIIDAARRARAIVVAAGDTPSLEWEYDLIAREGLEDKTIILIPPGKRAATEMRLERLRAVFPNVPLADESKASTPIAFVPAPGNPRLMIAARPRAEAYLVALRSFFQSLTHD